ncbi:enoyl-CoA hydratase-related protein, partial [Actibacterium sp.]|uniref:enoyl-CoA hydratase-related protein n=1 Tax=Actibacterium sp. TaxID=1872125 RepID=UPI003562FB34
LATTATDQPQLGAVCDAIEDAPVPVIAVVQGAALGTGCALALAAHYRIASDRAAFGFPEVTLGRVPEAGATQRLPRITGAQAALEIMLAGRPIAAPEAERLGLVDRITSGDPRPAAQDYAETLISQGAGPRPTRLRLRGLRDGRAFQAAVAAARKRVGNPVVQAPARIIDCIEAAQLLPFEGGLEYERAATEACAESSQARALLHLYQAERRAGRLPISGDADPGRIEQVALVGQGDAAAGWAVLSADSGTPVRVPDADDLDDILTRMRAIFDEAIARGRLTAAQRDSRLALVSQSDLDQADLVLDLTGTADAGGLRDGAIVARVLPATGAADLAGLDDQTVPTVALIGTGPAHLSRLTEMLEPAGLPDATRLRLLRFLKQVGRVVVATPAESGGLGSALWGAVVWVAARLAAQGAAPEAIQQALRAYGLSRLPFQTRRPPAAQSDQAAGLTDTDIARMCEAALANTGALLIEAGLAHSPADIDLVMVHGYGFPRWRGGPMLAADERGLLATRKMLRSLAAEGDADFWAPSGLFDSLIKNGRHFRDMNDGTVPE